MVPSASSSCEPFVHGSSVSQTPHSHSGNRANQASTHTLPSKSTSTDAGHKASPEMHEGRLRCSSQLLRPLARLRLSSPPNYLLHLTAALLLIGVQHPPNTVGMLSMGVANCVLPLAQVTLDDADEAAARHRLL